MRTRNNRYKTKTWNGQANVLARNVVRESAWTHARIEREQDTSCAKMGHRCVIKSI